jgi:hypothetical protein
MRYFLYILCMLIRTHGRGYTRHGGLGTAHVRSAEGCVVLAATSALLSTITNGSATLVSRGRGARRWEWGTRIRLNKDARVSNDRSASKRIGCGHDGIQTTNRLRAEQVQMRNGARHWSNGHFWKIFDFRGG